MRQSFLFFFILFLILIVIIKKRYNSKIIKIDRTKIYFIFDLFCEKALAEIIKIFILNFSKPLKNNKNLIELNIKKLKDALISEFKIIKNFEFKLEKSNKITFFIELVQPLIAINKTQLFCENNIITESYNFATTKINALKNLKIKSTEFIASLKLTPEFIALINNSVILNSFKLKQSDSNKFILKNKEKKQNFILLPTTSSLQLFLNLHKKLIEKFPNSINKSKIKKKQFFDLRFKNQIIIYKK